MEYVTVRWVFFHVIKFTLAVAVCCLDELQGRHLCGKYLGTCDVRSRWKMALLRVIAQVALISGARHLSGKEAATGGILTDRRT